MATKGYREYRGRGSTGKKLLIALLVLVLLGACAFLALQRHVVYHEDGSVSLELPFQWPFGGGEDKPIDPEDVDIQREEETDEPQKEPDPAVPEVPPFVPAPIHATELSDNWLYGDVTASLAGMEAVAVNVKRPDGSIAYHTEVTLPSGVLCGPEATRANLEAIAQSEHYTVARLSALCDNAYAAAVPDAALTNTWGGQWVDNYNRFWLDPMKEETAEHLCALAKELAAMGFDEIVLEHLRFPIEGDLGQTTMGADYDRAGAIASLAAKVKEAVGPGVGVSILLPGGMGSDGTFERSGLPITVLTESFDRIYVPRDSWAYYWLIEVLPGDYDRASSLVITGTSPSDGSYYITY